MAAAETLFAGLPGESYSSPQPPLVSPSLQSYQVMHPLPPKSDRLLGCGNPGRRNFGRKPQRTPGRSNDDGRRQVHLDNIRHVAAARFCQLRATLLPRAEPADPIHDELAYRDHRREIDGTARGPNPRADHLFRTRVVIGVSFSCRNADGLSAALFRRQFVGELMPPGYPCDEPSALPGGDTKDLRRRIVPETPGGKGDRRQQRLQITRRHVHIQTLFIKHVNCKTCFVVVWYSTKIKTERDVIQILQYFRTRYSCLR